MGAYMKEDDCYIPSLLELLNLRFAPPQCEDEEYLGGLTEMIVLQKEFNVFQRGRPFVDSVRLLNLGGVLNARARNRWYRLLAGLENAGSNQRGKNGDQAIVGALIDDLARKGIPTKPGGPKPVFFMPHNSRKKPGNSVIIDDGKPIFYIELVYLTISIPMASKHPGKKRKA